MPKLIHNGAVVEDQWLAVDPGATEPAAQQILTLDQWQALAEKATSAVQLEPDQPPAPLLNDLSKIVLIAISFPVFTDGRGFSYARELRERGFQGELRAVGHFIRDQLPFLQRCGFDAFQLAEEAELEAALADLGGISEHYQAAIVQSLPLARRR